MNKKTLPKPIAIDTLDYLLINGQINFFEHRAGIEFRRFYFIVNGAPNIRSSFPSLYSRKSIKLSDHELKTLEAHYLGIMHQLGHYKNIVLDICVFNTLPTRKPVISESISLLYSIVESLGL